MYNRRVAKHDPRVEAYGATDELNAALGMVRAFVETPFITDRVLEIQKELVTLMGELAVAEEDRERYRKDGFDFVTAEMVDRLTAHVMDIEKNHHVSYKGWATPGATRGSAALDMARTVCRRAERRVAALGASGGFVNPETVRYLNRLSDLCWLWARWLETQLEMGNALKPHGEA